MGEAGGTPEHAFRGNRHLFFRSHSRDGAWLISKTVLPASQGVDGEAARLRHEYQLLRELDGVAGVVQVRECREAGNAPTLVMDDAGSTTLAEWLAGRPTDPGDFLALAIRIAEALAGIHQRNIIHRNVTPHNIVLNDAREPTLIDFALATHVMAETTPEDAGTVMESALSYMAPEQTGRTGRAVDQRSDLYSLGATFYQMLTGRPPFDVLDAAAVIHAHLAQAPLPPLALNPDLPRTLSDLVMRLLAKMPEQRYQSASAVVTDLREAMQQWRARGQIEALELGHHDRRDLVFPRRLYGREPEQRALEEAFARVRAGGRETLWLVGPPGVGKTALMQDFEKRILPPARVARAKAEPADAAIPYALWSRALDPLLKQWAEHAPTLVTELSVSLQRAVGAQAWTLANFIHELRGLIDRNEPGEPAPADANRLVRLAFVTLLVGCATPERPLVLLMDDLQWADPDSLGLLNIAATHPEVTGLLLVGAFRWSPAAPGTEPFPGQPASALLDANVRARTPVHVLRLGTLSASTLQQWLTEVLRASKAQITALSQVVLQKTRGDPLFVQRFLHELHKSNAVWFDRASQAWRWDLVAVRRTPVPDDVVDLLLTELRELPEAARHVLSVAARIGSQFELWLLAEAMHDEIESVGGLLWQPLREGLLETAHPRLLPRITGPEAAPGQHAAYRFTHDRVQQAARALTPDDQMQSVHLSIARFMTQAAEGEELDRWLFAIVDQYARAGPKLCSAEERLSVAKLELRAARRAMGSGTYAAARPYLQRSRARVPGGWKFQRRLMLDLSRALTVSAIMTGHGDLAEATYEEALGHCVSPAEEAELQEATLHAFLAQGKPGRAVELGLQAARRRGEQLPSPEAAREAFGTEHDALQAALAGRKVETLEQLPEMESSNGRAKMRILSAMVIPAWTVHPQLGAVLAMRMVRLTMQLGVAPESSWAFVNVGQIFAQHAADHARAERWARASIALARRFGDKAQEARALLVRAVSIQHGIESLAEVMSSVARAEVLATEVGDLSMIAMARSLQPQISFSMARELALVAAEIEPSRAYLEQLGEQWPLALLTVRRQGIRCLQGRTRGLTRFDDAEIDEAWLKSASESWPLVRFQYHVMRLQVAYTLRDLDVAFEMAQRARRDVSEVQATFDVAELAYYTALTDLAQLSARPAQESALRASAHEGQRQMSRWAEHNPDVFAHKRLLVQAELARVSGRPQAASALYDEAMEAAARAGFLQDQALSCELAGRARLELGLQRAAITYLQSALDAYQRWGATAKVQSLIREFPKLGTLGRRRLVEAAEAEPGEVDFNSLLKAAEALSGEIVLEHLLTRLMGACLEVAGAERAILVLETEQGPSIEACGEVGRTVTLAHVPLRKSHLVPITIIEACRKRREPVLLTDAAQEDDFGDDAYVTRHGLRSVLAVPFFHQARLKGVLYADNRLVTAAFTEQRVRALRLLASQFAISLAKSQLFARLNREIDERRRAQDALALLADSSAALNESLDYRSALDTVARLAVPFLADGCAIDLLEGDGEVRRVALAESDPGREAILRDLQKHPPRADPEDPVVDVIHSGRPLLIEDVNEDVLARLGIGVEQIHVLMTLQVRSAMIVPLLAHGHVLGVVHLVSTSQARRYTQKDLAVAREWAGRVAVAVENARLFEQAQDAVRARNEFLSIASHELRTPLNALLLSVELLSLRIQRSQPRELVTTVRLIERQTRRLGRLVTSLLDVSRIQVGRLEIQPEAIDLSSLVRDVTERLADELARAGCSVTTASRGSSLGHWDRMRMEQVIVNLLSNAAKFGAGKPIEVETAARDGRVRLTVCDRGIGIPPERLPHIFDRFERGVSGRSFGGLGLGLYITRTIVEAHGGSIRAERRPGGGSCFIIDLPRHPPPRPSEPAGVDR